MRSLSIDILKIILSFFVVFLHMHVLRDTYPSLSYVLVNGLFRIAVPVFLIITGYYFFYIDTKDKLRKWLIRIFILYAIWTLIYIPFWKDDQYILNVLFGYHHLWYLIGTFFAGIILYIFRKQPVRTLSAAIFILFCIGYALQFLGSIHYFKGELDIVLNTYPSYRNFLFVCFPFLGIGFLLKKQNIETRFSPSRVVVILSVILVMGEAYFNYKILGLNTKESIDLLFSLLIACPVVFLYCKHIVVPTDSKILASISTAIYLVHPLIMIWIFDLNLGMWEDVVFILSLLAVSFLLVAINRKIKYLL
ncbi:acyltransferase family protein [Chryseobacterium sp. CT-SW4]|uniref:acyltransferase family protein n=1 Tax=Chryseobacterium sp. SW-1 TaxID=3157343 RepID=UPI003B0241C4